MNHRLMLMQLYLTRQANIPDYSEVTRQRRFGGERYLVDDRLGVWSLQTY